MQKIEATNKRRAQKFLTFMLNGVQYGVDVKNVKEVVGYQKVTPIPESPECLLGVIDLRGRAIPLVDLRKRFGIAGEAPSDAHAATIILEQSSTENLVGAKVDMVACVLAVQPQAIQNITSPGGAIVKEYVVGITQSGSHEVVLLSTDALLKDIFSINLTHP